MSNNLKKYKRKVKSFFGKTSSNEESMLTSFFSNIDEYPGVDNLTYNELVEQFGEPEDIFCTYVGHSTNKALIQKQSFLKNKKRYVLITLILLSTLISVFILKAYNDSKQSYVDREQIEIIRE